MDPASPEFQADLAALGGKVDDREILMLLLRQLRDSELAAPTIIQVDGIQNHLDALIGKIKEFTVQSFDGDLSSTAASSDVIKQHITRMLESSLDAVLRNWAINNIYMVPIRDERAYADYGIAAALLSDISFARMRAGLPPLPANILRDAVKESMAMSSALLRDHVTLRHRTQCPCRRPIYKHMPDLWRRSTSDMRSSQTRQSSQPTQILYLST